MLKNITTLSLLCILVALSGCGKSDFQDHRGNSGNFSDYQGKWMIINYWAVWCKPCIEEIPELNHFAESNSDTVVLFGVDYDNNQGEKLQQGIDKLGINFPVLTTDPAISLQYQRPNVLPTTLIFNPEGKLHRSLKGPQTEQTLLDALN
ncbi:TlpA family protein disulfide reductase [Oceanicoccus sagamiensis]|uniref:Thioredoxin n=1 Tax=Oceanicoccus sagamiensis TaxID=716816 RepID=A0A1X9NJ28_9GAMM|nr:TlpA disulfide reductase family protein [Oceanicoccus sagamiensis]ARN74897.1 thioredoxin [Oceanicoccus sagamiensis]